MLLVSPRMAAKNLSGGLWHYNERHHEAHSRENTDCHLWMMLGGWYLIGNCSGQSTSNWPNGTHNTESRALIGRNPPKRYATRSVSHRTAISAITNYQRHVTPELYKELQNIPVLERWKQVEAIILFKFGTQKCTTPIYMTDLVKFTAATTRSSRRHNPNTSANFQHENWRIPISVRLKTIFSLLSTTVWNAISVKHFRVVLKHFQSFDLWQRHKRIFTWTDLKTSRCLKPLIGVVCSWLK